MKKIIILAAMGLEINAVKKALGGRLKQDSFEIVFVRTGMGKKSVRKSLGFLAGVDDIAAVISTGVAGGVNKDLKAADVVVPARVRMAGGDSEHFPDRTLIEKVRRFCEKAPVQVKFGGSAYTVDSVFGKKEKEALLEKDHDAVSVDMESSYISEIMGKNRIPFIIVRGISDSWDFKFPDIFSNQGNRGNGSRWSSLKYFINHPADFARTLLVWKNCVLAAKNTASAIKFILPDLKQLDS